MSFDTTVQPRLESRKTYFRMRSDISEASITSDDFDDETGALLGDTSRPRRSYTDPEREALFIPPNRVGHSFSEMHVEWSKEPGEGISHYEDNSLLPLQIPTRRKDSIKYGTFRGALNTTHLLCMLFLATSNAPWGVEPAVGASSPLLTLIGLVVVSLTYSLPQALMCAELSSMICTNHGAVAWVYRALGPAFGFFFAMNDIVSKIFDMNAYLLLLSAYTDNMLLNPRGEIYYTIVLKIFFALMAATLASFNMRIVGNATVLICFCVVTPLLIGFAMVSERGMVHVSDWTNSRRNVYENNGDTNSRVDTIHWPVFVATLLWLNTGWDIVSSVAGELAFSPRKVVTVFSTTVVTNFLVYFLALTTCFAVTYRSAEGHRINESHEWKEGYLIIVYKHIASWFGPIIFVGCFLANFGAYLVELVAVSRMIWALADSSVPASQSNPTLNTVEIGALPLWVGALWERTNSPVVAVLILTIFSIVITLSCDFTFVIETAVFFMCIPNLMKFTSFIALRYTEPMEPRPFRVGGGVYGAWICFTTFAIIMVALFIFTMAEEPIIALMCCFFNGCLVPVYMWRVAPNSRVMMPSTNGNRTPKLESLQRTVDSLESSDDASSLESSLPEPNSNGSSEGQLFAGNLTDVVSTAAESPDARDIEGMVKEAIESSLLARASPRNDAIVSTSGRDGIRQRVVPSTAVHLVESSEDDDSYLLDQIDSERSALI